MGEEMVALTFSASGCNSCRIRHRRMGRVMIGLNSDVKSRTEGRTDGCGPASSVPEQLSNVIGQWKDGIQNCNRPIVLAMLAAPDWLPFIVQPIDVHKILPDQWKFFYHNGANFSPIA